MKITAVRIRVLRSHRHGYGHDAAEFEAALGDGDDPQQVADELRQKCEAQLQRGLDTAVAVDTLEGLIARTESQRATLADLKQQCERMRLEIAKTIESGVTAGCKREALDPMPF